MSTQHLEPQQIPGLNEAMEQASEALGAVSAAVEKTEKAITTAEAASEAANSAATAAVEATKAIENISDEVEYAVEKVDDVAEKVQTIIDSADVKDVVQSHKDLDKYDTSTLGDNDVIKVLKDEEHENATTYYRYNKATKIFDYIGQIGPYYTTLQMDDKLREKQDVLVSGKNIKTINGESIVGEGNIKIEGGEGGGGFDADYTFETKAELDELDQRTVPEGAVAFVKHDETRDNMPSYYRIDVTKVNYFDFDKHLVQIRGDYIEGTPTGFRFKANGSSTGSTTQVMVATEEGSQLYLMIRGISGDYDRGQFVFWDEDKQNAYAFSGNLSTYKFSTEKGMAINGSMTIGAGTELEVKAYKVRYEYWAMPEGPVWEYIGGLDSNAATLSNIANYYEGATSTYNDGCVVVGYKSSKNWLAGDTPEDMPTILHDSKVFCWNFFDPKANHLEEMNILLSVAGNSAISTVENNNPGLVRAVERRKLIALPDIKSIGSGLSLSEDGVLSSTGGGGGAGATDLDRMRYNGGVQHFSEYEIIGELSKDFTPEKVVEEDCYNFDASYGVPSLYWGNPGDKFVLEEYYYNKIKDEFPELADFAVIYMGGDFNSADSYTVTPIKVPAGKDLSTLATTTLYFRNEEDDMGGFGLRLSTTPQTVTSPNTYGVKVKQLDDSNFAVYNNADMVAEEKFEYLDYYRIKGDSDLERRELSATGEVEYKFTDLDSKQLEKYGKLYVRDDGSVSGTEYRDNGIYFSSVNDLSTFFTKYRDIYNRYRMKPTVDVSLSNSSGDFSVRHFDPNLDYGCKISWWDRSESPQARNIENCEVTSCYTTGYIQFTQCTFPTERSFSWYGQVAYQVDYIKCNFGVSSITVYSPSLFQQCTGLATVYVASNYGKRICIDRSPSIKSVEATFTGVDNVSTNGTIKVYSNSDVAVHVKRMASSTVSLTPELHLLAYEQYRGTYPSPNFDVRFYVEDGGRYMKNVKVVSNSGGFSNDFASAGSAKTYSFPKRVIVSMENGGDMTGTINSDCVPTVHMEINTTGSNLYNTNALYAPTQFEYYVGEFPGNRMQINAKWCIVNAIGGSVTHYDSWS